LIPKAKYLTKTFRGSAEINRVGLDQVGIELVLADQLAEAVADLGTAVVSRISTRL